MFFTVSEEEKCICIVVLQEIFLFETIFFQDTQKSSQGNNDLPCFKDCANLPADEEENPGESSIVWENFSPINYVKTTERFSQPKDEYTCASSVLIKSSKIRTKVHPFVLPTEETEAHEMTKDSNGERKLETLSPTVNVRCANRTHVLYHNHIVLNIQTVPG